MKIVREFPHGVREIPHFFITLRDGTRLAARMWLPDDVEAKPAPVVLEYLPYRKGDGTAIEDATRHRYFAGHGIASIRVDIRGSGDSDGLLTDEYSEAELNDAVEVIAWLAVQPWCNGRVGMFGISWGGFNALQVAALAPPALRAVISLCSTDDRYADDVHYMGGAVLANEMLGWAMTFLGFNVKPPDPQVVGERWRDMWQQRLEGTPAFVDTWLEHQERERISALLSNEPDPYPEPESDWEKQAKAVLIPTPGYGKSYTEIEAELIADGVPVPPGIKMIASAARDASNDAAIAALKWRPKLSS